MDGRLEQSLFDNYPTLYKYTDTDEAEDAFEAPPQIAFDGISCDNGWYTIIDQVSSSLEAFNNDSDTDPIHAVQVKEKFGGLRFYTDRQPDAIGQVISLAEELATKTCEKCGTTTGAQPHSKNGWKKTLCESCALDWRDVDTEVEIWRFTMDCHQCETETPVVYPRHVGGNHGGTWETVGPILKEQPYCQVEKLFSDVQRQYVWGNTCISCDAYQGNYYVYEAAQEHVEQAGGWYPLADFDCIDKIERVA